LVYGDGKNYLVALIVINKEFKKQKEIINKIINEINKNKIMIWKIVFFVL